MNDFHDINIQPATITIAELTYPKPVKDAIKRYTAAWDSWAEATSDLYEAKDAVREAEIKDAAALVEAVKAGKPDPGESNIQAAQRAVKYQAEKVRQARTATNRAADELNQMLEQHIAQIVAAATDKAEAGLDEWAATIDRLREELDAATQARWAALDGLMMLAEIQSTIRINANFTMLDNVQLPNTTERHPRYIIEQVRKAFGLERDNMASEQLEQ